MGPRARSLSEAALAALAAVAALLCWPALACADEAPQAAGAHNAAGAPQEAGGGAPCSRLDADGSPYAICIDPGNRLFVSGSNLGAGAGFSVRHTVSTVDPGVTWRMEHRGLYASAGPSRFGGAVYEGRFIRHARDGRLVFPSNPPVQLSVPFDIGAEASVGRVSGFWSDGKAEVGAVRAAALADFARATSFRGRAAIGAVVRWDMTVDREQRKVDEQRVAPFTVGVLSLYAESESGLTLARLTAEGGTISSTAGGFRRHLLGEIEVERVLVTLNDLPVSLYAAGRYEGAALGLVGELGVRFAVLSASRVGERR
jgi:catechol 2,3-dioxygenase-like lactoylglutathione lyase family enzyme